MSNDGPTDKDGTADEPPEDPMERLDFPEGPNGILSDKDRIFLLSGHPEFPELDGGTGDAAQKRWRIRQKVENALHDFQLLQDLDHHELDLILDDVYALDASPSTMEDFTIYDIEDPEEMRVNGWGDQFDQLLAMMVFLHRACEVTPLLTFEYLIEEAVREIAPKYRQTEYGARQRAKNIDVDATINVDIEWVNQPDVDEVEKKLERGESLTREEIGELFLQGRIEPGDLSPDDVSDLFTQESHPEGYPGLDPEKPEYPEEYDTD